MNPADLLDDILTLRRALRGLAVPMANATPCWCLAHRSESKLHTHACRQALAAYLRTNLASIHETS